MNYSPQFRQFAELRAVLLFMTGGHGSIPYIRSSPDFYMVGMGNFTGCLFALSGAFL